MIRNDDRNSQEKSAKEKANKLLTLNAHTVQPVIRRIRCNNVI